MPDPSSASQPSSATPSSPAAFSSQAELELQQQPFSAAIPTLRDEAPPPTPLPTPPHAHAGCLRALHAYCTRWAGVPGKTRAMGWITPLDVAIAASGSFLSIAALALLQYLLLSGNPTNTDYILIGSFGATAVLLYAAPAAHLAQPRNVIGGHIVSALIGVIVRVLIVERGCRDAGGVDCAWLGCALAVSLAITAMLVTNTLHPPGGATALIAVLQSSVAASGFLYVLLPVATGSVIMVAVALLVNNVSERHRYPQYWL